MTDLIDNTARAEYDCPWCSARKGRNAHSRACPIGERYKQVQKLGGIGWPKGKLLLDPSELNCQRGSVEGQTGPEKPASRGSESGANSAETFVRADNRTGGAAARNAHCGN